MDFRVYVVIEVPILDKKFELFVPIDRRIHDLLRIIKETDPELSRNYYENRELNLFNKTNGKKYDLNMIIKNSDIKMGTRLVLI
jgi:hypothetical protein